MMYHVPQGQEQRRHGAAFSAAISGLGLRSAWPYGHDVEVALETTQEHSR